MRIQKFTKRRLSGYESEELVNHVTFRNNEFRELLSNFRRIDQGSCNTLFAISYLLAHLQPRYYRVLDLGGGGGHIRECLRLLYPNLHLIYTVIETQAMVDKNESRNTNDLAFMTLSHFLEATKVKQDLVLANSSLQYFDDPLDVLNRVIAASSASSIWIGKTPFHAGAGYISGFQETLLSSNGPQGQMVAKKKRIEYHAKIISMIEFQALLQVDYRQTFQINEGTLRINSRNSFGKKLLFNTNSFLFIKLGLM